MKRFYEMVILTAKVVNDRLQDSISRFAEVLIHLGLQFSVSVRFIRQPKGFEQCSFF